MAPLPGRVWEGEARPMPFGGRPLDYAAVAGSGDSGSVPGRGAIVHRHLVLIAVAPPRPFFSRSLHLDWSLSEHTGVQVLMTSSKTVRINGVRLRLARKKHKWSQGDLARHSNVSRSYITEIEQGKKNPSIHIATILAHTLEVELDELVS